MSRYNQPEGQDTLISTAPRDKIARIWQREDMNAKAELAELVMDHLSRTGNITTAALASAITGLAKILTAYNDAQEKRGNWGTMLANLRSGIADIAPVLPHLRTVGPSVAAIVQMAEREVVFANVVADEITRLTAGESTNV